MWLVYRRGGGTRPPQQGLNRAFGACVRWRLTLTSSDVNDILYNRNGESMYLRPRGFAGVTLVLNPAVWQDHGGGIKCGVTAFLWFINHREAALGSRVRPMVDD